MRMRSCVWFPHWNRQWGSISSQLDLSTFGGGSSLFKYFLELRGNYLLLTIITGVPNQVLLVPPHGLPGTDMLLSPTKRSETFTTNSDGFWLSGGMNSYKIFVACVVWPTQSSHIANTTGSRWTCWPLVCGKPGWPWPMGGLREVKSTCFRVCWESCLKV